MIKELPLLMQGDMVRALLRKISPKINTRRTRGLDDINLSPDKWQFEGFNLANKASLYALFQNKNTYKTITIKCPYGKIGDRLWIREKQKVIGDDIRRGMKIIQVKYEADGVESKWLKYPERLKGVPVIGKCLSYGGFRESSRLTLEITDIRVERIQEITEIDAQKEGAIKAYIDREGFPASGKDSYGEDIGYYKQGFEFLWDSINEKRGLGWDFNPWVWVIEFKLIKGA